MTVMRDQVVKQLVQLEVKANENGLIPALKVLVNQLPWTFWNTFAERIMAITPPERKADMEAALVNCAYEYGYHTGYGIVTSPEFESVVTPMVTARTCCAVLLPCSPPGGGRSPGSSRSMTARR